MANDNLSVESRQPLRRYALVTAAYNEEAFIEGTLKSVVSQTVLPDKWIIVSDGSTDSTDALVQAYVQRYPFIHLIRRERGASRNFASKVTAVHLGFNCLRSLDLDFIGTLDADITIASSYFEDLLQAFESNPRLGLSGGWIHEATRGEFFQRPFNSLRTVPHAIQLMRTRCYEDIGDYVPLPYGGTDTCAGVTAEMHGWEVECMTHLPAFHHRRTASAGSPTTNYLRLGMMEYSLGYHPVFQVVKCLSRIREKPYLIRSLLRLAGFWLACARREPRPVSDRFIQYLRRRQIERIRQLVGIRPIGPRGTRRSAS